MDMSIGELATRLGRRGEPHHGGLPRRGVRRPRGKPGHVGDAVRLPVLDDDPTEAQLDAWIERAALVSDRAFRTRVREMVVEGERVRAESGVSENDAATRAAGQAVVDKAGAARVTGVEPESLAAAGSRR